MTADPKALLLGPLQRAGVRDAEIVATEQVALLRGHHLLAEDGAPARRKTKTVTERKLCGGDCYAVELVGDTCPICGWSLKT